MVRIYTVRKAKLDLSQAVFKPFLEQIEFCLSFLNPPDKTTNLQSEHML